MTNRTDLVALAKSKSIPGTNEVMVAIDEAYQQLKLATMQLNRRVQSAQVQEEADSYEVVGSFMKEATDYEVAAGKLNTLFLTLAILLQNGGVEINY